MRSLSSSGIGLSLVFGCLLLALVAEVYYLLWWKKKLSNSEIEDDYNSSSREVFYLFCWKRPTTLSSTALTPQQICSSVRITDTNGQESENHSQLQSSSRKDLVLKPYGEDGIETEMMRLHNLAGPPRFLSTINEETKEDLESEDGQSRNEKSRKGSRSKSLSDLLVSAETPFSTPLSSPPFFTPPLTPMDYHGFNPLFESSTEAVINKIRSSPPPRFKFMRDAEAKFCRKTMMEAQISEADEGELTPPCGSSSCAGSDKEDGSFITITIGKNPENNHMQQPHSGSSQVLPLPSSPSAIKQVDRKPIFH